MTKIKYFLFFIIFLISPQFVEAQNAPDFSFTDTEGVTRNLQERLDDGYIVLLDFFFVDCPPCIETGIELQAIHDDYQGKNVEIWSISPYDSIPAIQEFQAENDFTYIAGGIEGGGWEIIEMYTDSLGLEYFPTISVICSNGDLTWDIWPYTSNGAPEWRGPIENCGVHDVSITASSTENVLTKYPSFLFPNPAKDLVNIDFYTESIADVFVEVYDMMGRKSIQSSISINNAGQQNEQLSVAKLLAGNYILRLSNEDGTLAILPFQK